MPEDDQRQTFLETLLAQAIAGDENARNQLLEELLPRLRKQIAKLLPYPCRDAQSDVLCSVIRRVIEQPDLRPTLPHFLGWIGVIIRNRCHDEYRNWVKRLTQLRFEENIPATDDMQEDAKAEDHLAALVLCALELLPEHYREILQRTCYGGMSCRAIGEKMCLSEGNVRILKHRALKKMKKLLGKLMENHDAKQ